MVPAVRIVSHSTLLLLVLAISSSVFSSPTIQRPFLSQQNHVEYTAASMQSVADESVGVGHFSEWSAMTKAQFLADVKRGNAANWTIVMGNEGGDLDSMASAFTWAYHLGHMTPDRPAIGLLQTPEDALDLRPENKLALENVKMSSGHSDLLTIDELPLPADQLATQLRGIVLVDHPEPSEDWRNATILSIFDHHNDRGKAPDAEPRIFLPTASCSTLVGRQMLNEIEKREDQEYHLPHELLELLLSAIAIDSNGLQSRIATPTDKFVASRLWRRSNWHNESMYEKMEDVAESLKKAKKDLDSLSVRDLLRRDWKGGIISTPDTRPDIHLGFASTPYPLSYQISITPNRTATNWFQIERNWTSEIRADATVALNSYKVYRSLNGQIEEGWFPDPDEEADEGEDNVEEDFSEDEDDIRQGELEGDENIGHHDYDHHPGWDKHEEFGKAEVLRRKRRKTKERQIVLVVRHDHRLNETLATELFLAISRAVESSDVLRAQPWRGPGWKELGPRQMVWTHNVANGGRKLIRPIVEEAVSKWGL